MTKGYVDPKELPKELWIPFSNGKFINPQNHHEKNIFYDLKQDFEWGRDYIYKYEAQEPTIISINTIRISLDNKKLVEIFNRWEMRKLCGICVSFDNKLLYDDENFCKNCLEKQIYSICKYLRTGKKGIWYKEDSGYCDGYKKEEEV